jgi:thiamine kinase-like enzyme
MTVIRLTKEEIRHHLNNLLNTDITLTPIGNHSLKRHQVYSFHYNGKDLILKFYYINQSLWEISALNILKDWEYAPKVFRYGAFENTSEYLITYKEPGIPLSNYENRIPTECYYEKIGSILKQIHSFSSSTIGFNHQTCNFNSIKEAYNFISRRTFSLINNSDYGENDQIIKRTMKNFYKILDSLDLNEPVLTHRDFDSRNILVTRNSEKLEINKVIDYEHSLYFDPIYDLANLYFKKLHKNDLSLDLFNKGYGSNLLINDRFLMHLSYILLSNISWSKNISNDLYNESIEMIRKINIG